MTADEKITPIEKTYVISSEELTIELPVMNYFWTDSTDLSIQSDRIKEPPGYILYDPSDYGITIPSESI